jgi:hypothetical protein
MTSSVENRVNISAMYVVSGQPHRQTGQKPDQKEGRSARSDGQVQNFPDDVVTLSAQASDSAIMVEKKKQSLAVTPGERKALLGSKKPTSTFSIYG